MNKIKHWNERLRDRGLSTDPLLAPLKGVHKGTKKLRWTDQQFYGRRAIARSAVQGLREREQRVAQNKPVFGLEGIESPLGDHWIAEFGNKSQH